MKQVALETARLHIRPIENKDAVELFEYRSDAITNKFQGFIPKKIEEVFEFIKNNPSEFNIVDSWFQLVIIEKKSKKLIGDIGVHFIDTDKKQVELGITIAKKYQKKGFASEALKEIIYYLFNELGKHRITASIDPENNNSIKLFEGIGFRKEAHFIESLFIDGKWVDDVIYAILKKEWK
jgi:RimJ/RimL family protein N-acetyltransferase